jgi:hypothetical protein
MASYAVEVAKVVLDGERFNNPLQLGQVFASTHTPFFWLRYPTGTLLALSPLLCSLVCNPYMRYCIEILYDTHSTYSTHSTIGKETGRTEYSLDCRRSRRMHPDTPATLFGLDFLKITRGLPSQVSLPN